MRVALAIAAILAVPLTAAADEPTPPPTSVPGIPGPGVNVPGPAPAPAPTDATSAPGETAPASDAPADPAYGERPNPDVRDFPAPRGKDVVIVSYPERSKQNMLVLGGMAATGVILGAVGLYFHLDSRSASNEVTAQSFTGEPWTPERQVTYDRAHSSSIVAGVMYGIGGGLLLATAIAFIVTEPEAETLVIQPHGSPKPTAVVAPIKGGALVGGTWRF